MTVQERLEDISSLSGYSKEVVSAVLKASMASLVKTLRVGERANLPGICNFTPALRSSLKLENGIHEITKNVAVRAKVSKSLITKLEDLDDFEAGLVEGIYKIPNVAVHQIEGLE